MYIYNRCKYGRRSHPDLHRKGQYCWSLCEVYLPENRWLHLLLSNRLHKYLHPLQTGKLLYYGLSEWPGRLQTIPIQDRMPQLFCYLPVRKLPEAQGNGAPWHGRTDVRLPPATDGYYKQGCPLLRVAPACR